MSEKRFACSSTLSWRSEQLAPKTSGLFQPSFNQPHESRAVNSDTLKIISSPDRVFEVIRSFDQRKKDMVRSIGFGGILHLSRFTQLDPNFTVWLLRKVRWKPRVLAISQEINLPIKPEHIGKIIGIPYSGIEVSEKAFREEDEKLTFMKQSLSFLGKEEDILQSAEAYLAREVVFGFSKEDAHRFKVAFVIFVMGRFLAPCLDTSSARSDYWGALKNPDSIHSFNWSSFVLSDTMEASRLVVWSILRSMNLNTILGCPLIMQIFYLDNIDLRQLNLPHDVLPRVKHFNSSLLSRMIEADYDIDESSSSEHLYGCTKTLRTDNICYSLHPGGSTATTVQCYTVSRPPASPQVSTGKTHQERRNFSCSGKEPSIQNDIPNNEKPMSSAFAFSETDVPDFSMIMREYFQGQVDPSLLECFRFHQAMCIQHLTKFVNGLKSAITKENINLVSKVVNHQRLSSGLSSINLELSRPSIMRRTYDDMLSGGESGDDNTPGANNYKHSRRLVGFESPSAKKDTNQARFGNPAGTTLVKSPPLTPCGVSHLYGAAQHQDALDTHNFSTPDFNSRKPKRSFNHAIEPTSTGHTTFTSPKSGLRMLGQSLCSDQNERSPDVEYTNFHTPKKKVQPGGMVVPHWERNIDHPIRDFALTHSFYDWLSSTSGPELKQPWIIHDTPRHIQISGQQLKDHFTDVQSIGYDAFDLCVRRMMQLDKYICPKDVHLRWRQFIESDFSMHMLAGDTPLNDASIRRQFASSLIDYELERCRMFFVPVLVDGLWWCYAWDLKSLTLTINDPSVGQESDALVIQKHAATIEFLSRSLFETVLEFYSGWFPKFQQCNTVVFRCQDMPIERSKSALYTLFFMKNYNGTNLVSATTMNALKNFKEYMLYEILELKGNRVHPPSAYTHSVDD